MSDELTQAARRRAYDAIEARCVKNDRKWGEQRVLSKALRFAVLAEEFGEIASAIWFKQTPHELDQELIDTAAVLADFIEANRDQRAPDKPEGIHRAWTPLDTLLQISVSYGHLARAILEREAAGVVRVKLAQLMRETNDCLLDTYQRGYEPRAIEGETDQEGLDITAAALASFSVRASPDVNTPEVRATIPVSQILDSERTIAVRLDTGETARLVVAGTYAGRQPQADPHRWTPNEHPVDDETPTLQHFECCFECGAERVTFLDPLHDDDYLLYRQTNSDLPQWKAWGRHIPPCTTVPRGE